MDDDARARFRSRWRELLEGDPTRSRIYKDMGNGVATAGIEYYLPLFFEETATVFDYLGRRSHGGAARRPGAGLPAFLAGHARALPAGAGRPGTPGAAAGGAVPDGRAVLRSAPSRMRSWRSAAPAARSATSSRAATPQVYAEFDSLPPLAVVRGADDPLARLKDTSAQHAAPRAGAGRERRPARKPAGLPARQRHQPAGLRFAGGVRGQRRREDRHRHRRRWPPASPGSRRGIDFVTETELFAAAPNHAPAQQEAGAGQRRRGADQGPVASSTSATRWCTRAARHRPLPRAWSTWTWARAPTPTASRCCRRCCTWNTPTRPRSTCRCRQLHQISRYTGVSRRRGAAAQAGLRPVGKGQAQGRRAGARLGRRTAQHLRPPRRARRPRLPLSRRRTTRSSPTTSASRKRPTRTPRSMP